MFALAEEIDFTNEDGELCEGGDGVVIVAVKIPDRENTYWILAWHNLFEYTLAALDRYQGKPGLNEN